MNCQQKRNDSMNQKKNHISLHAITEPEDIIKSIDVDHKCTSEEGRIVVTYKGINSDYSIDAPLAEYQYYLDKAKKQGI